MPIVTIRNAAGPGDAAQGLRPAVAPIGQRAEAIQKIVDALGRHLSGQEVLSRDAVVRLVEDLSRLLKSSALPPESGRILARRLLDVLESLPAPERLAIEREFGGRSPAQRAAIAARGAGAASTGAPAMAAAPQTPERTAIRNLPLLASLPPQHFGAKVPASGDLALVQAMLRKTFGADEEGGETRQAVKDGLEPGAGTRPEAGKVSNAAGRQTRTPTDAHDPATAEIMPGPAEDGAVEAAQRALPEAPRAATAKAAALLPAPPGGDASGMPAEAASKSANAAEDGADATADGLDADGTYGPPRAKGESDRQQARPATLRNALAEAVKALAQEAPLLPDRTAANGRPPSPEHTATAPPATTEPTPPDQPRDAALRPQAATAGAEPLSDPAATELPDAPAPNGSAFAQQRPRQAGEDPALQQTIALLVESGLPKEIVPFALVPYPPAEAEAESGSDEREQPPRDGHEAEAGAEDGEGGEEKHADGDGDTPEEPDAADAYDLYRKLGGLG